MKHWRQNFVIRQYDQQKTWRLIKKFQDFRNEKILKVDQPQRKKHLSLLNSNTKKINEQLINIEGCPYKLEQYSRRAYIEIQGIPQTNNNNDNEFGRYCDKDIQKTGIVINKHMINVCHRLGKTTKAILKFANREDAEPA